MTIVDVGNSRAAEHGSYSSNETTADTPLQRYYFFVVHANIYTDLHGYSYLTNTDEHGRGTDFSFLYESDEFFLCAELTESTETFFTRILISTRIILFYKHG